MSKAPNPLAFPRFVPDGHYNGSVDVEGMSLRDYFAAAALQGLCANGMGGGLGEISDAAEDAYHLADAMLEVRSGKEGTQP